MATFKLTELEMDELQALNGAADVIADTALAVSKRRNFWWKRLRERCGVGPDARGTANIIDQQVVWTDEEGEIK